MWRLILNGQIPMIRDDQSESKSQNETQVNDVAADKDKPEASDENMDEHINDAQQHGKYLDTCMQPVDIGQEILDQHFDGTFSQ